MRQSAGYRMVISIRTTSLMSSIRPSWGEVTWRRKCSSQGCRCSSFWSTRRSASILRMRSFLCLRRTMVGKCPIWLARSSFLADIESVWGRARCLPLQRQLALSRLLVRPFLDPGRICDASEGSPEFRPDENFRRITPMLQAQHLLDICFALQTQVPRPLRLGVGLREFVDQVLRQTVRGTPLARRRFRVFATEAI